MRCGASRRITSHNESQVLIRSLFAALQKPQRQTTIDTAEGVVVCSPGPVAAGVAHDGGNVLSRHKRGGDDCEGKWTVGAMTMARTGGLRCGGDERLDSVSQGRCVVSEGAAMACRTQTGCSASCGVLRAQGEASPLNFSTASALFTATSHPAPPAPSCAAAGPAA